jgi:hypothetical protein
LSPRWKLRAVEVAGIEGVEEETEARDNARQVHRIFVSWQAGNVEGVCGAVVVVVVAAAVVAVD